MKTRLKSKKELAKQAKKQVENGGYRCVWDTIYFTDCYDKKTDGTIHGIMKLYDNDDDSIRLSFDYHIHGNFYTEYIENATDICSIKELLKYGEKIFNEKVCNYKFTAQPDWNN
jgi:hypothetical protein